MPKLFTNSTRTITMPNRDTSGISVCVRSYKEYLDQRVLMADAGDLTQTTSDFQTRVTEPMAQEHKDILMGQYFVIPVSEILKIIASPGNPEFIHICNGLRKTTTSAKEDVFFPVTILVPIVKTTVAGKEHYERAAGADAVYSEAYPCPPHPDCPVTEKLLQGIFKEGTTVADFNSLI